MFSHTINYGWLARLSTYKSTNALSLYTLMSTDVESKTEYIKTKLTTIIIIRPRSLINLLGLKGFFLYQF